MSLKSPTRPGQRAHRAIALAGRGAHGRSAALADTARAGARRRLSGALGVARSRSTAFPASTPRRASSARATRSSGWTTTRRSSRARPATDSGTPSGTPRSSPSLRSLLETLIGLAMALIMHKAFAGAAWCGPASWCPWAIPTAISALLWRWIFQRRHRQRPAQHPDAVDHRGLPGPGRGHHRRHLEDGAVHRAAGTRRTADHPRGGLRGGQGRRRRGRYGACGASRCRWSSRRCWWPCCSGCWTRCGCSTCRSC